MFSVVGSTGHFLFDIFKYPKYQVWVFTMFVLFQHAEPPAEPVSKPPIGGGGGGSHMDELTKLLARRKVKEDSNSVSLE